MLLLEPDQEMSDDEMRTFLKNIQQGDDVGTYEAAYQTVKFLRQKLMDTDWVVAREAIELIKKHGAQLRGDQDSSIGNMIRRVLKIVKEEYFSSGKDKTDEKDTQESLQKLLLAEDDEERYDKRKANLKDSVIDSINVLLSELETSSDLVCRHSLEHIQHNEVIITLGNSRLVQAFFQAAAKEKKKFQVIVAESYPNNRGHLLAKALVELGIKTTLIGDAAIFAMMSRCNKVIIGTQSVMADGGLKALSGTHTLALAASHYSVPMLVLAPMYKLTPQHLSAYQDDFNHTVSPHHVMPYSSGEILSHINISCPLYDYVPPRLVTLYATNIGGYSPPYIYRLLADLYHQDDYNLQLSSQSDFSANVTS
ncbi:translation initiation factor eIF2B subunit beta-like [Watersipora subatra]|uniref:translation initiation factor eIF2B subunit beta-like n=1 Tax=Watersipora subatra TaxID=2589382 RepID=UPI00355BB91E